MPVAELFDPRLPDRFWDKIEVIPFCGCWIWVGCQNAKGYGRIGWPVPGSRRKTRLTHVVAFEVLSGDVPAGLDLDHICRTHSCCNPYHLEPVTRLVNIWRGVRKDGQTRCKNGHPLDEINAPWRKNGKGIRARKCKTCNRVARRKYDARCRKENRLS